MNKKVLLITSLFLCTFFIANGQTPIPNAGFENWTMHTGFASYETPDGWQTLNQLTAITGQQTAKKDTHKYSGVYAIRLQGIAGIPIIGTVPGILSSGTINQTNFSATGGFPINFRPLMFKGYYMYDLSAGLDTATIAILLTKWNTATSSRDTVGIGGTQFRTNQSTYTSFNAFIIPTPNYPNVIPDTVSIIILSGSLTSANPGALYLDDLSFFPTSSGIDEVNVSNHFFVYPNPASANLTIRYDEYLAAKANLIISDVTGRILFNKPLTQQNTTLNISDYSDGMYFYRLVDMDNRTLTNGKFLINNK